MTEIAHPLVQALKPQPRTEPTMTTPQSPWDIWHRRDPDDFHRAAEVEADVCALCNDDDATEREESK